MDDTLKEDLEAFKLASDAEKDQREAMLDDLKFVKLGEQWPQEVIEKRAKEGRPCLTINRLPAFAKQVTNDARQNRPAIKTHPIGDKADKETAEIAVQSPVLRCRACRAGLHANLVVRDRSEFFRRVVRRSKRPGWATQIRHRDPDSANP